jgi:uncharacterized protein (DUF58 family)
MKVHRSGKFYIVMAIILGILALNSGNNFHYLAAAAVLGYMAASGEAGKRNIKGASVSISFPEEIYAGIPFRATIEVRNTKRFSSIALFDVSVGGGRAFFSVIRPGESVRSLVEITLPSRGTSVIDGVDTSSAYPFNLFTCNLFIPLKTAFTVFPKPVRAPDSIRFAGILDEEDLDQGSHTSPRQHELPSDSDVVGVRPYVEGDSMRLIHWKSSAKTGVLKSRLYDSPGGGKIIDLDKLIAGGLERGLSFASGEICDAMRSGMSIGMKDRGAIHAASSSRVDKLTMLTVLANHD